MDEIKWPSDKVRSTFIEYFTQKREHLFVPSSPTVPYDDPTLLFANSGMTQFKPIFLGNIDPKSPQALWKRAANSQKCIRAGGKHNDLDDVGKDTYHHTYFEMLGNWSFSNYFQEEAIDWAWDLLVNVFGLDPTRLYVTYFKGDVEDGLPADDAAKALWGKYLPPNRILPFGRKENFWEMGDTGPCGPCSEIHYDRLGREDVSEWVNADSPDVIEIWNLVFMAYNREQSRKLTPLPHKHVDTGMGFERLTSILQDKPSNYDTDVFKPYFDKIQELTGATPYTGRVGADDEVEGPEQGKDTAYRIVADHIRTLTFAITDGAIPSADGRGYVLRRILRRAVRTGRRFLGAKDGFFHQLVDTVVEKCGGFFPELNKAAARVKNIIKKEEESFQSTLNRGEAKFKSLTKKAQPGDMLSGADTFLLYGTFGFPLDLIAIMAAEKKMNVDIAEFEVLRRKAAEDSAIAYAASRVGVQFDLKAAALAELKEKGVGPTDDSAKYLEDPQLEGAVVKAIWKGNPEHGSFVPSIVVGEKCGVVLDKTNFYAECGGQIFDTGFLESDTFSFLSSETKVYGGYVAHIGSLTSGELKVGDVVTCSYNVERRRPIMSNHTSTHLTNFALRKTLENPADQRGSIVVEEKFRFDFTAPEALTAQQIKNVEDIVNDMIAKDLPVHIQEVSLEEATKIAGVRALFAEAYPNPCRVVCVGASLEEVLADKANPKWNDFSIEFCGGTHITKTSQAENFVITSEEAVRVGERRIVAVTGSAAREAKELAQRFEAQLVVLVEKSGDALNAAFLEFMNEFNKAIIPAYNRLQMRKDIGVIEAKIKAAAKIVIAQQKDQGSSLIQGVVAELGANESQVIVRYLENSNNKVMSDSCGDIVINCQKSLNRDVAVMLFTKDNKKKNLIMVANVPPSLVAKGLKANEWCGGVATVLGGKGGGSPKGDVAQGFCNSYEDVDRAIQEATKLAQAKL